ncbi:MAG: hypothetical protein WCP32_10350 [Bacteroidota bacterium]
MGFDLKKSAIKAVLPMVTDFLPTLDGAVDDYRKSWIEKRPLLQGEDVVCVLFFEKSKMHITVAVINEENKIIEQLQTMLFSDFVTNLINAFKNS